MSDKLKKITAITDKEPTAEKAIDELLRQRLIVSRAEGRRLIHQMKEREKKNIAG